MPTFDYERAATILAETAFSDDQVVCRKYGITDRTLRRYRERLLTDPRLSAFVREKQAALAERWADELGPAIGAAVRFLRQAAQKADPKDPAAIRAVAEALRGLAEIDMTRQVLQSRMGGELWDDYSKN